MEENYPVTVCGQHVGNVSVHRQGLYYHFRCTCDLQGKIIYRLMVSCNRKQESLGVLVPMEGCFIINKKLPVKQIGEGDMVFFLLPKQTNRKSTFVPISPEEPFAYISRLKDAFLTLRDGQPGILIEQKQER